jgi:hypothetical protein
MASTDRSFVFSLTAGKRYPIHGRLVQYAVYNGSSQGPTFGGGHDIYTNLAQGLGSCVLGHTYTCHQGAPPNFDNACSQELCGADNSASVALVDVEVFYESNDP